MSQLWKLEYTYYSGDVAKMCGVHRATVNRWLNDRVMEGRQMPNGQWLIPLKSINDIRESRYGMSRLSHEDADEYWQTQRVGV